MSERAQRHQRRPHTKSRSGCIDCKQRRIKCSEEKPTCKSCIRHGLTCVYPNPATPSRHLPESNSPVPSSTPSPYSDHGLVPIMENILPVAIVPDYITTTTFDMNDLALLHHWTISTSRDIVRCPQVDYCWQTVFPRIASQHPFVMHGILSISALHLAYSKENKTDSIVEATRHHNTSLQGFHGNIMHISDQNSEGLLVSSILNIIYVFGMLGRPSLCGIAGTDPGCRNDRAFGIGWVPVVRGVRAVLHSVYDRVRLGPLSPLLNIGNWDELDLDCETSLDDEHLCRIQETWADDGQGDTYDEALQVLRRCYLYAHQFKMMDQRNLEQWGYNRGWAAPLVFLCSAPDEYFIKLRQRQPPALVLFAYFGALLHNLNEFWFLEGWGHDIVEIVDEQLGSYWRSWTDRPRRIVGLV